jgi:tetratricopeptide (TPR) repeat protein
MKQLLVLIAFLPSLTFAQYNRGLIPRSSPEKTVAQKIGYTQVNLNWSSPSVRGRQIWGDIVPYNELWRVGANAATTVEFSTDVTIDNKKVSKGKYAMFLIPNQHAKWTLVLNTDHEQWGAYSYDKSKDVLRCEILPKKRSAIAEDLSLSISQYSFIHGAILVSWEFMDIEIPFETDFLNQLKLEVVNKSEAAAENAKWAPYLQGAEYLEEINMNLDWASAWIDQAEKLFAKAKNWDDKYMAKDFCEAHIMWTKAKILARKGEFKEALALAQKVSTFKDGTKFYSRPANKEKIDAAIKAWDKK